MILIYDTVKLTIGMFKCMQLLTFIYLVFVVRVQQFVLQHNFHIQFVLHIHTMSAKVIFTFPVTDENVYSHIALLVTV